MGTSTSVILQQMGVIVILVSIGIYLYKKGTVDSSVSPRLSAIVVDVCNPALILASILSGNITATRRDLVIGMIIGVIFYTCLIILGFILPRILRVKPDERRYYNMMTIYTNTGFIGIPVAKAILPENAILYVIVINVMYSLLFYTHGITVLSAGKEKLSIEYRSVIQDSSEADAAEIKNSIISALEARRADDIICGYTTVGVHRDDLSVKINDREARKFGSQGQQRSAVLALKLAEAYVIGKQKGETPVVLLDDVLSELDSTRQNYLLNKLEGMQVFITCCEKIDDTENKMRIENGEIFSVEE